MGADDSHPDAVAWQREGDQGPWEPRPGVITDACYTFVDNENKFLAVIAADV